MFFLPFFLSLTVPAKSNSAEREFLSMVTAKRIGVPSSMKSSALTVPTCDNKNDDIDDTVNYNNIGDII